MQKGKQKANKTILVNTLLVKTDKDLANAYRIKKDTLSNIEKNMKKNGYDRNFPILVWAEKGVVIDGHTRLQSAKNRQISRVPVTMMSFDSKKKVYEYILHLQNDRRNATVQDQIRTIQMSDWKDKTKVKNKKKYISELIHCSERQAAKFMSILNDPEQLEKILNADENDNVKLSALTDTKKTNEFKVVKELKKITNHITAETTKDQIEEIEKALKDLRKRMREVLK